jgi:uncharacterized membrane protein
MIKSSILWFIGIICLIIGFFISWEATLVVIVACTLDNAANLSIKSKEEKEYDEIMKKYKQ